LRMFIELRLTGSSPAIFVRDIGETAYGVKSYLFIGRPAASEPELEHYVPWCFDSRFANRIVRRTQQWVNGVNSAGVLYAISDDIEEPLPSILRGSVVR